MNIKEETDSPSQHTLIIWSFLLGCGVWRNFHQYIGVTVGVDIKSAYLIWGAPSQ